MPRVSTKESLRRRLGANVIWDDKLEHLFDGVELLEGEVFLGAFMSSPILQENNTYELPGWECANCFQWRPKKGSNDPDETKKCENRGNFHPVKNSTRCAQTWANCNYCRNKACSNHNVIFIVRNGVIGVIHKCAEEGYYGKEKGESFVPAGAHAEKRKRERSEMEKRGDRKRTRKRETLIQSDEDDEEESQGGYQDGEAQIEDGEEDSLSSVCSQSEGEVHVESGAIQSTEGASVEVDEDYFEVTGFRSRTSVHPRLGTNRIMAYTIVTSNDDLIRRLENDGYIRPDMSMDRTEGKGQKDRSR